MKDPKVAARVDASVLKERAIQRRRRSRIVNWWSASCGDGWRTASIQRRVKPTNAQLAAAQLLGRTVALFDKQVVEKVERSPDEIAAEIEKRLSSVADDSPLR